MTLVTRPRSRRSSAWRKIEGNRTWRVTRRERWVAFRAFRGLLLALFGRPDTVGGNDCGRESKIEVRRSRGEGNVDREDGIGIVHGSYTPARYEAEVEILILIL